jgi:hypothetical protein
LGYSTEGIYGSWAEISPATDEWLDAYGKESQYVQKINTATASITQAWQELKSGNLSTKIALKFRSPCTTNGG